MGKASRSKGRRGQTIAKQLLRERDWQVDELAAGIASEDLIATDTAGRRYCVEVKNTAGVYPQHVAQAKRQAASKRMAWMLMSKIAGTSSWLVQRQGENPSIWMERQDETK